MDLTNEAAAEFAVEISVEPRTSSPVTPEGFHTRSSEVFRGVLPRSRNSFDGGLELNMLQHRWETIAIIAIVGRLFNSERHGQVYAIRCKE